LNIGRAFEQHQLGDNRVCGSRDKIENSKWAR
jgi:hypothetical protein